MTGLAMAQKLKKEDISLTTFQTSSQDEQIVIGIFLIAQIIVFLILLALVSAHETIIINKEKIKIYRHFPFMIGKSIPIKEMNYLSTIEELELSWLMKANNIHGVLGEIRKGDSLVLGYKQKELKFGKELSNPEALLVYSLLDGKIRES